MTDGAGKRSGRVAWLDAWRGSAVYVMIGWHLCWDLGLLGLMPLERMTQPLAVGVRYYIVCSFVLLSGIVSRYSLSNLRRGIQTLACALVITLVTYFAGQPAWFGILHLLGCCMLLYAWLGPRLQSLPETPTLIACLALFAVFHVICYRVRVSVPGLWMFGFRTPTFRSSDWYPLLPWGFLFLAGTAVGGRIRRSEGAWKEKKAPGFLTWPGRHALWIYMLHQPLLLGALALISGRTPW